MSARRFDPHGALSRVAPYLVAALGAGVFANALANGFALDDQGVVLNNPLVHGIDGVWRAFVSSYWPEGAGQYRPLVIASFTAEWALWGDNPVGFHAVNVLWHTLVCALVFLFARRWLSFGGSVIAAALFAVHPVHVEAVANIVGRSELMAAAGVLGMLLLHERRSPWAVAVFAAALFSKEHALVAPALALLIDFAVPPRASRAAASRAAAPRAAAPRQAAERRAVQRLYAGYAAVAAVWGAAVIAIFHDSSFAAVDVLWRAVDAPTRWLTMLGVVPMWIGLWFFPTTLSADYSPRVTAVWPDNLVQASVGAVIVIAACALAFSIRRRAPAGFVAFAWLAITVSPVANVVVPTGVILAERTLYLSSIGAVLALGLAGERLAQRRATLALALTLGLVAAGAARTWVRTPVWHSTRSVLLATAETHPQASWTHVLLARVYSGHDAPRLAIDEYRRAVLLYPGNPIAWSEAAYAASNAGDIALADSLVTQARRHLPNSYLVSVAHAFVALERGRFVESVRAAQRAARIEPDSAVPHLFEGIAWARLGAADSARRALGHIPRADPRRATADSVLAALAARPM